MGPKLFPQGYFEGPDLFLWVFRGSEFFSRGYFVCPKFFLVGIWWVKVFSSGYFVGPNTPNYFNEANILLKKGERQRH